MKAVIISMVALGLLGSGLGGTYAAHGMGEKESTPTIKERFTKDAVKGILINIEGQHYFIKDNDGKEKKVHVVKRTKLDKVLPAIW